jgi:quinohemoprotein ethanol dehydrogenase
MAVFNNPRGAVLVSALLLTLWGCGSKAPPEENKSVTASQSAPAEVSTDKPAAAVNGARIAAAASEPNTWLSYGRGYDEQRFSPLDSINEKNAGELGLAWTFDIDHNRGQEATPIVVDGIMYTTGAWSIVYALDAVTGKLLWKHDPEVPRQRAQQGCCDVANRGVAVWEGKVVFGTYDGRLQALDAATGKVLWSVVTVDQSQPYTISGAPRIIKGKVLIGNGGAEFGVRGYISAYDVNSGEMLWRFYTVPGNPADGFESEAMEMAAETWKGEWWKLGGGGTVWDSMAYDPELDLLYIGVGNGSPWNQRIRSPGGGDNLFLSSIVALPDDAGRNLGLHGHTTHHAC